jgi:hypothetical protein
MNLSAPLDKLSFDDLDRFPGLSLAQEQRIKEGETIDWFLSLVTGVQGQR